MELHKLKAPFPANKISWRVGATSERDGVMTGIPFAYIDARDVMERLDNVCGQGGWQAAYPFPGCCSIGIRTAYHDTKNTVIEWVWKANGAGETDIEAAKGQYSDAFKRAAVLWGIGQYLYDVPNIWLPVVKAGRSWKFDKQALKDLSGRYDTWVKNYFNQNEGE